MKKEVVKKVRVDDVDAEGVNFWRVDWSGVFFWAAVVLVVLVVWFWIFSYEDCRNKTCFDDALKNCDRAEFAYGSGMIFEYKIEGREGDGCEVVVKLLQGDLNDADSRKLEGHEMSCVLPMGVVMNPESDMNNCHGLLKEGLQNLIINKLHNYLVQNLGRLNLEMADLPGVI